MKLFGHSLLQLWGPRIMKNSSGFQWHCKYTGGGTVGDPACVFWNHFSVYLIIGRLFLSGFELMWG